MTKSIILFILMIATVASADTQDQKLQFKDFKELKYQNVWTYLVTRPESDTSLVVRLELPRCTFVRLESQTEVILQQELLSTGDPNLIQLKFTYPDGVNAKQTSFEVIALKSETKNGEINWIIEANPNNIEGKAFGPVALDDSSTIRFVIAAGSSVRLCDETDFKMENGALLIENDNRIRPSLVFGTLLRFSKRKKPLDVLLSLEFANGTSRILNSLVFGFGLEWSKYLEFYVGLSVSMGQKVSDGFEDAAKQLVREIEKLPDTEENKGVKSDFKRFRRLKDNEDFDGFPTISPISKERIFPGDPLINRTNKAVVFGVAVPFEIIKGVGF